MKHMVNKDALNQQISEILAHHDTLAYLPEWQVRSLVPLALGHSVNTVAIAVGKDPKTISKMMKTGLCKKQPVDQNWRESCATG